MDVCMYVYMNVFQFTTFKKYKTLFPLFITRSSRASLLTSVLSSLYPIAEYTHRIHKL